MSDPNGANFRAADFSIISVSLPKVSSMRSFVYDGMTRAYQGAEMGKWETSANLPLTLYLFRWSYPTYCSRAFGSGLGPVSSRFYAAM